MRRTLIILTTICILVLVGCGGGGGRTTGPDTWIGTWEVTNIQVIEDTGAPHTFELGFRHWHGVTGQVNIDGSHFTASDLEAEASYFTGYDVHVSGYENSCDGDTQITNATLTWTDQHGVEKMEIIRTTATLQSDTVALNEFYLEMKTDGNTHNIDHVMETLTKISDQYLE